MVRTTGEAGDARPSGRAGQGQADASCLPRGAAERERIKREKGVFPPLFTHHVSFLENGQDFEAEKPGRSHH